MARLGCKCGAEMTNTVAPSEHILNIYYMKEAEDAIRDNPNIRLWDFYTGWDEKNNRKISFKRRKELVEYWYCTECKKIYEVQAISCGKMLRGFEPSKEYPEKESEISKELVVLWDVEMDNCLSDENMTLKKYLNKNNNRRYFISEDEVFVLVKNNQNETIAVYKQFELS